MISQQLPIEFSGESLIRDEKRFYKSYNAFWGNEGLKPFYTSESSTLEMLTDFPFPIFKKGMVNNYLLEDMELKVLSDLGSTVSSVELPIKATTLVEVGDWICLSNNIESSRFKYTEADPVHETSKINSIIRVQGRYAFVADRHVFCQTILDRFAPELTHANKQEQFIVWTTIGSTDLLDLHFGEDLDEDYLLDAINLNSFGWHPHAYSSRVEQIVDFNGDIIVFSDSECYALVSSAGANDLADLPDTFGFLAIGEVGLSNPLAVCKFQNNIVFLARDGCLWVINNKLQLEKLSRGMFSPKSRLIPFIKEGVILVTSDEETYCVNNQVSQIPHTKEILPLDETVFIVSDRAETYDAKFTVYTASFFSSGMKNLTGVGLDGYYDGDADIVIVDHKNLSTGIIYKFHDGFAITNVAGQSFKVFITFKNCLDLNFKGVYIRFQSPDTRFRNAQLLPPQGSS